MAQVTTQDLYVTKGDTFGLTVKLVINDVETEFTAGDTVWLSVKEKLSDTTHVLQKEITTFTAEGYADATLLDTETDLLDECTYWYDVQWDSSDDETYTIIKGRLIIDKDDITG